MAAAWSGAGVTGTTAGRISTGDAVSIGMAVAGISTATALSMAATSGFSGEERRKVTRVRGLPISTTSSAAMETTAGGRVGGMARAASRLVPVRSTTNTPGAGLYEV
jgi:hypothetical protein